MIPTRVTETLAISFPIFQGGMAWVGDYRLAAAVSEGGGLGIIGAGAMSPDELRRQIKSLREVTDKPFGVNLLLFRSDIEDMVEIVRSEEVPVVTTGAGSPGKYMEALMSGGSRVFPVVASVDLARRVERYGATGVICEGHEAAGHIGDMTTMTLAPQVADAVKIPVVAAGGIADGRGMAAAFMLGAEAVQMGTRFICTEECTAHRNYKERIVRAGDRATMTSGHSLGHPIRAIRNRMTQQFLTMEREGLSEEEIIEFGTGKLRLAAVEGNVIEGSVMAGQSCGLINDIPPVAELMQRIMTEAESVLRRLMVAAPV